MWSFIVSGERGGWVRSRGRRGLRGCSEEGGEGLGS